MSTGGETSGVRIPPPLFYLSGFFLGAAVETYLPDFLPWRRPDGLEGIGAFLIATAGLLFSTAVVSLWRAGTTVMPERRTTAFVTSGPYRLTRNPIYLAMALLYVGVGLILKFVAPLLVLPVVVLVVTRYVIVREERYLSRLFGENYDEYRARVRRWL